MKKIISVVFLLSSLVLLTACGGGSDFAHFTEVVKSYQEKVDEVVLSKSIVETTSTINRGPYKSATTDFATKESLYNDYVTYQSNHLMVNMDPLLLIYQEVLDNINEQLEANEIESLNASVYLSFGGLIDIEATLSLNSNDYVLIKANIIQDTEVVYKENILMGYEEDAFFIKDIQGYREDFTEAFEYFEFLENDHMVNIRNNSESYWYRYQNEIDHAFYEISSGIEPSEGQEDLLPFAEDGYIVSAYDTLNDIDFQLMVLDNEVINSNFRMFNDHGIVFEAYFKGTTEVDMRFQLLEADGWDTLVTDGSRYYLKNEGIIVANGLDFGLASPTLTDSVNTSLRSRVTIELSEYSEGIYELSDYGLMMNQRLTFEEFESYRLYHYNHLDLFTTYQGISFLNQDAYQQLYDLISDDIK